MPKCLNSLTLVGGGVVEMVLEESHLSGSLNPSSSIAGSFFNGFTSARIDNGLHPVVKSGLTTSDVC